MNNQPTNKINWKVRFKNGLWVSTFVSQLILLVQFVVLGLEGLHVIDLNLETMDMWVRFLVGTINVILGILAFLGIVSDPTVEGVGDSRIALKRSEPLNEYSEGYEPRIK